jgi:Zn-dependent peptidase ImmA (M78 family)
VATQQIGDRFGKTFTWDLKVKQMGLASLEYASLIVSEMELPMTPQQYLDQVAEIHAHLFPTALLMPGQKTPSTTHKNLKTKIERQCSFINYCLLTCLCNIFIV